MYAEQLSSGTEGLYFDDDSIKMLKVMGSATFFIHGFNVPQGKYPFAIEKVNSKMAKLIPNIFNNEDIKEEAIEWANYERTFFDSRELIAGRYDIPLSSISKELDDEKLNGTGVCNWFIHMENNLNVATNQFDYKDYTKYSRIVGVSWAGDVGAPDYLQSEDRADFTAKLMLPMIQQLIQAKIKINIIAHSMGNRVLIQLLNILGQQGHKSVVEHVFMWDAALPDTALSNNPQADKTTRKNCHFVDAHKAANKFTVLYSRQDDVLSLPYWLATYVGKTVRELLYDHGYPEKVEKYEMTSLHHKHRLMALMKDPDFRTYLENWVEQNAYNWLDISSLGKYYSDNVFSLQEKLVKRYQLDLALGYNGPNMKDPFIQKLYDQGRLFLADMTKWGVGHSYMRVPTKDVMKYGYKTWVINKIRGMKDFGFYDPEQFPTEPAYSPE